MAWQPPARKDWVAHLNALGSNLADGGRSLVPLDPDRMLEDARQATGLDDFGDDWFQEPYRVLVKSLEEEARLTLLGRIMIRSDIARVLESRLRVEDLLSRHPEIEEQPVAPVHVVTGLGRSGTSILHELFTLDPDNRVPMLWEMNQLPGADAIFLAMETDKIHAHVGALTIVHPSGSPGAPGLTTHRRKRRATPRFLASSCARRSSSFQRGVVRGSWAETAARSTRLAIGAGCLVGRT